MSGETSNTNSKHNILWLTVALAVVLLVVFAGWYFNSSHFRDWVRARLISQLEDATGGRVEMGSFRWNLSRLEFDVRNITIHGLEEPGEVPYASAKRLLVRAKILSVLGQEIGLRLVQVDGPVIHIIVYPDGHTNQPVPKVVATRRKSSVQRIFELAIDHAEVNDGQFILNEQKLPLDFSTDELKAAMDYVAPADRYSGTVKFGALKARYSKYVPASGNGEMQFNLTRNALEVNSFRLNTGKSEIEGSGKLSDFSRPVIDLEFRGTVDGREVSQITRTPELREGTFQVSGAVQWANGKVTSKGKLLVRRADYRTPRFHASNVDATADYSLDENKLVFSKLGARVFGGLVRGEIAVENWLAPPSAKVSNSKSPELVGIARLRVDHLPIGLAAEGVSTTQLDLARLNLVGNVQGTVITRWRGSLQHAVTDLNLTSTPPASPQSGQLPVAAELKGTYDGGSARWRVNPLNVTIPDIAINAMGVLGSRSEPMHVTVVAADLRRLQPMLAAVREQDSNLGKLTGKLNFNGTLTGDLLRPVVEGDVDVSDFEFPLAMMLTASAANAARPERLHIDAGSGNVEFSPQGLIVRHGSVRHGKSRMDFDIAASLSNGSLTDSSPIRVHLSIRDGNFAELQQIAGYSYPVTGAISANLNVSGTKANPEGSGHLQFTGGSVYGEPVKSVSADLQFAHQEFRVSKLLADHNGAQIKASGTYNLGTRAFNFHAVGSNFQLAKIARLQNSRLLPAGVLNFSATGSGTTQKPIVNASAHLHNLVVNGQRVGDATLMAVTQDETLKLSARSNFQSAVLTLDGTVKLADSRFPVNVSVRFTNFDFMPFLQPALQGVTARSFSEGTVIVQGPLRDPKELTVKAEIPRLTADMQGIQLHNVEPVQFSMMNQVIRVDSFKMVGPDTQMDIRGTVRLAGDDRIRLRAEGRMNLKLAQSFNSDLNSSGYADFNVAISGVVARPTLQGEVRVANGAFSLIDFPNGLSNVNGSLVFTEDRVQVQSLTAHTGGGDIEIGGFATYSPQLMFNLTAKGQDIRLRYPQGVSSTANINLKLTGSMLNSMLSGDVTITRFGLNSQFDLANYLGRSNRPMEGPSSSVLNNLRFNVHVVSTPELQLQSSLAKLAGNVDVRLRGSGANPVLLGRVNVTEGQFSFNGQTYKLQRGDVTFNNPTRTEPNIDVEATTRVRDYDLTLGFHGQLSHGLNTNYRSDPPLPQADILNLLAFGRTREEAELASQTGTNAYTGVVSSAILGQALNTAVGDRVQKLFGVSRVKISPEVGTTQTNPTAQVMIEQQVSNKVTITYITSLSQSTQQSIFVEYNINPQLSVIAGRDQYGVVSFDVRVRQRKR